MSSRTVNRALAGLIASLLLCTTVLLRITAPSPNGSTIKNGVQTIENHNVSAPGIGLVTVSNCVSLGNGLPFFLNWWPTACLSTAAEHLPSGWTSTELTKDLEKPGCGYTPDVLNIMMNSKRVFYSNKSDPNPRRQLRSGPVQVRGLINDEETFNQAHHFIFESAYRHFMGRSVGTMPQKMWYPFDTYRASITFEAFSDLAGTQPLPIKFIRYTQVPGSEIITLEKLEQAKADGEDLGVKVTFVGRRSLYVKVVATGFFCASHILAAAMLIVAVRTHRSPRPLAQSVLFLPLASALLLPKIRQAMPDFSPSDFTVFFYIDLLGYYVDIVAITLATSIMMYKTVGSSDVQHVTAQL